MSPLEVTLLALCGAALAGLVWLYVAPLELDGELRRERGEGFAGRLRLKLGLVSLQGEPARAGSLQLRLQVGGLGVARWKTTPREKRPRAAKEERGEGEAPRRSLAWARRHWDLRELLDFLFDHRNLLVLGPLEGRVEFSLEDPALTGELFGYGSAARQMSRALAGVEIVPLWSFENGAWGWLRGRVRARLVALLMALALHLVTHYRRGRTAVAGGPGLDGGTART